MYVEFNESENPERDWEISAEFYPEERKELDYYISATREVPVRTEVPRESQGSRGRKERSRQHVHQCMLQSPRRKACVRASR